MIIFTTILFLTWNMFVYFIIGIIWYEKGLEDGKKNANIRN